jgi:uncharacterized protein HemX
MVWGQGSPGASRMAVMAEDGPRFRMPRVSMPAFSRREDAGPADSATTETQPEEASKAESNPPAKGDTGTKSGATKAPTTPVGAKTGTGSPEPNLQERIEGLQGWVAEIERKQARLTYFGALAVLLAIAAAGAALYFGLTNRSDSAKKSDLDALTKRVDSLQGAVTKNSKDTQNALNASIAQLQQSISGLQKQQTKTAATISTLQAQVAANAAAKGAAAKAAPTGTTTTATTPGASKKP